MKENAVMDQAVNQILMTMGCVAAIGAVILVVQIITDNHSVL